MTIQKKIYIPDSAATVTLPNIQGTLLELDFSDENGQRMTLTFTVDDKLELGYSAEALRFTETSVSVTTYAILSRYVHVPGRKNLRQIQFAVIPMYEAFGFIVNDLINNNGTSLRAPRYEIANEIAPNQNGDLEAKPLQLKVASFFI